MGAINIKHTGSGSDIALSSDGTSLLLNGTAIGGGGGGADLYAANESSPAAQPSATGANAIAIGDSAIASDVDAFAGPLSRAAGGYSVALGVANNSSSYGAGGSYSISIGYQSRAMALQSVALGAGAYVDSDSSRGLALGENSYVQQCDYGTAIGAAARVHGGNSATEATAFGSSYASGTSSFAAAITNNTSSYGATGANSIAIGQTSKATDSGSVAIGKSCISDGGRTVALGHQTTASSFYSFAVGALSEALETGSVTTGVRGRSNVQGKRVHSSSTFSAQIGNCQTGELVLGRETTDATSAQLTSIPGNSASTNNQVVLPNNSAFAFHGTVIARENSSQTDDFAVWEIKGGAVRGANAASTALGSYNINKISETTGAANWSIALSADTTNGAVAITVTGEASHSIRWVATVNTTEVTY